MGSQAAQDQDSVPSYRRAVSESWRVVEEPYAVDGVVVLSARLDLRSFFTSLCCQRSPRNWRNVTDLSQRSGYDIYEEGLAPLCDERIVGAGKQWGATRVVYCQPRYHDQHMVAWT